MTYALIGNIALCSLVVIGVIGWLALAIVRSHAESPRVTVEGNQFEGRPAQPATVPRATTRRADRPSRPLGSRRQLLES